MRLCEKNSFLPIYIPLQGWDERSVPPYFMEIRVAIRIKGMYHSVTGIKGVCCHNLVWKADQWDHFTLRRLGNGTTQLSIENFSKMTFQFLTSMPQTPLISILAHGSCLIPHFVQILLPGCLAGNTSDSTLSQTIVFSWLFFFFYSVSLLACQLV